MTILNKNIIVLDEVDSTNNYAKQLLPNKVENGTVVLAQFQNAGKGQQGNYWESEAGKNLLCSIVLYPHYLPAEKQFYISKIISIALVELLKTASEDVKIKWPNDIYVFDKKIAGILIENSVKGNTFDSSIAGIGLNLNQVKFKTETPNPVSLKQLAGKSYNIQKVLNDFLEILSVWLEELELGKHAYIDKVYVSHLFRNREWAIFKKENREFEARIVGIGEYGQLQLEDKTGIITEFMFKEVEFVL